MSTQNVNVARFARNVEWDFFCDFQTPWHNKENLFFLLKNKLFWETEFMSCQIQLSGSRLLQGGVSQQVPDRDLKKWQKNPWKFVYILAKQCRSHFNLINFFLHQKNQNFVKKNLGHPVVLQERSRARVNCFRKEQKFLTFLYFSAFSQNCWKERRKERRRNWSEQWTVIFEVNLMDLYWVPLK